VKKPLIGSIIGCLITVSQYFYFQNFQINTFVFCILIGFTASFGTAYFISFVLPGLKGGKHNTGPSYMGSGRGGAPPGGIIQSDEEIERNKRK